MDRDRDRERRLSIPPEDQYGNSRGQSYRPNRSPPRDNYRSFRDPRDARDPRGPPYGDSYGSRGPPPMRPRSRSPPPFRRRSRSPPPYRRGGDGFMPRPRSPPRGFVGRDGPGPYRGGPPPPRDFRDEPRFRPRSPGPRGPIDTRSPLPLKRSRDVSPVSSRGRVSPPPAKRERLSPPPRPRYGDYPPSRDRSPPRRRFSPIRRPSPPRGMTRDYRPADRSPLHAPNRIDPRAVDDWRRPRSPSPRKADVIMAESSSRDSGATSRRSSPPIHPSRLAVLDPDEKPPRPALREERPMSRPPPARSPLPARSPRRRGSPPPPREREMPREREAPLTTREREMPREREIPPATQSRAPPSGPSRNDEPPLARAPPTGPGASRAHVAPDASPPTGPRALPTGPRPTAGSIPSAPRGAAPIRGGFSSRGDYPSAPRGRGGYAPPYRGRGGYPSGPARDREEVSSMPSAPPSGPRASHTAPSPSFRGSMASRGHRFSVGLPPPAVDSRKSVHPALASLPPIIEGGLKAPELYDRSRLDKLEEEAERIRKVVDEKQARKRKGLREWERLQRESANAAFRAELAEGAVRTLAGDETGGAAF